MIIICMDSNSHLCALFPYSIYVIPIWHWRCNEKMNFSSKKSSHPLQFCHRFSSKPANDIWFSINTVSCITTTTCNTTTVENTDTYGVETLETVETDDDTNIRSRWLPHRSRLSYKHISVSALWIGFLTIAIYEDGWMRW